MSYLDRILEVKRAEVAEAMAKLPVPEVQDLALNAAPTRGFLEALQRAEDIGLIAEIKASSPSQGSIRPDLDPAEIARTYESAGAHALSVLTDRTFFGGSEKNLKMARAACSLPVLRKDFIIDPYQVFESRAMGADAILLIVAALDNENMWFLNSLAKKLGMDVLAEVHDESELERALRLDFALIGVNNRNLSTFETDLTVSESLLPRIAPRAFGVSESALSCRADIDRVKAAEARAVLIGTTFCAAPDIGAKVREVMGWK